MRPIQELDSGIAVIANFRQTRHRLRNLKIPGPDKAPLVDNSSSNAAATARHIPESDRAGKIIPADIPPAYPEIVTANAMPMKGVVLAVAEYYGIPPREIFSKSRKAPIAFARQVAMYVLRENFKKSWHEIGRRVNRDHTSAIHAHRKIKSQLETDEKLRDDIDVLRLKLADMLQGDV